MPYTPRTEFAQALKAVATERGVDATTILETIKQAIVAAYKRDAKDRGEDIPEEVEFEVEIDPVSGEARIFEEDEEGKKNDITPPGFGRIAAQTAKQVIHQKIREAEKDAILIQFADRVGTLISGMILRFDGPNVWVDIGRTEAMMPSEERIVNERLEPGQRLTFLLKEIRELPRGKAVILSRSDPEFVVKLFAREVPEISSGAVEIRQIAREPGVRTKIAVASTQSGVDPVGSCVGQKGVRVQAVTNELGGERVDIVSWSDNPQEFVSSALATEEALAVKLNEKDKKAVVQVTEDQAPLAIGPKGQNARLASKLTGWEIEIEVKGTGQKEKKQVKKKVSEETPDQESSKKDNNGDNAESDDKK